MSGVRTSSDGLVDASAFGWRCGGRLHVTVAVRARFAIGASGVATYVGPGLGVVGERVPYRARCDVTFQGSAHAPTPTETMIVRLAVIRGGRAILDKSMRVVGARDRDGRPTPFREMPLTYERTWGGPSEANPVGTAVPNVIHPRVPREPIGLAPLPPSSPARAALVSQEVVEGLARPVAALPASMPWMYFQRAPVDQRIEPLVGGETLVLEGLLAGLPRAETSIPRARAVARARVTVDGAEVIRPVDLVCDELAVDGAVRAFELTWRGRIELPPNVEGRAMEDDVARLDSIRVEASLDRGVEAASPTAILGGAFADEGTAAVVGGATNPRLPFASAASSGAHAPRTDATPWSLEDLDVAVPARPGEETLRADEPGETTVLASSSPVALAAPFPLAAPSAAPSRPGGAPIWSATASGVVAPWERQESTLEPGAVAPDVVRASARALAAAPHVTTADASIASPSRSAAAEALAASLRRMGVAEAEIQELVLAMDLPGR